MAPKSAPNDARQYVTKSTEVGTDLVVAELARAHPKTLRRADLVKRTGILPRQWQTIVKSPDIRKIAGKGKGPRSVRWTVTDEALARIKPSKVQTKTVDRVNANPPVKTTVIEDDAPKSDLKTAEVTGSNTITLGIGDTTLVLTLPEGGAIRLDLSR